MGPHINRTKPGPSLAGVGTSEVDSLSWWPGPRDHWLEVVLLQSAQYWGMEPLTPLQGGRATRATCPSPEVVFWTLWWWVVPHGLQFEPGVRPQALMMEAVPHSHKPM